MWSVYVVLLTFCNADPLLALDEDKFTCETFEDLATVRHANPKCTYNPDIGDNAVRFTL